MRVDTVNIDILECQCGCRALAVSINHRRVADSGGGSPWRVLMSKAVSKEEILKAINQDEMITP